MPSGRANSPKCFPGSSRAPFSEKRPRTFSFSHRCRSPARSKGHIKKKAHPDTIFVCRGGFSGGMRRWDGWWERNPTRVPFPRLFFRRFLLRLRMAQLGGRVQAARGDGSLQCMSGKAACDAALLLRGYAPTPLGKHMRVVPLAQGCGGAHVPHLRWGPQRAPAVGCLRRGYVGGRPF